MPDIKHNQPADLLLEEKDSEFSDYRPIRVSEARIDKMIDLIGDALAMHGYRRKARLQEMSEAISDFPILLGGVINRMLMAAYQTAQPVWRKFIRVRTVSDFRDFEIIRVWGSELLEEVPELGEYKNFSRAEGKYTGRLKKYGRKYGRSWESIINDNLGGLGDISAVLNRMATKTEWHKATGLICTSSGPNSAMFGSSVTDPATGKTITNMGNLPLNITNLEATLTLMRMQVDADGDPMMITPKYLVVPQQLENTAKVILNSTTVLQLGGGSSSTLRGVNNIIPTENLELVVNPWLNKIDKSGKVGTTWYLFSDGDIPACQMTFLEGYENPQLAIKSSGIQGGSPTEGDFDNDSIWYRVRHMMGPVHLDPRGAYAQTGS